jgi:UDP-N-acetylglucosamine 1-carboxyvinyltransferase
MLMNKTLYIRGGRPLSGTVRVAGAKNAASKMMVASLLTDEEVVLSNCPPIDEISITAEICSAVGAHVRREGEKLTLETPHITSHRVPQLSRSNRISILALAPLLHRTGEAEVPTVGGDAIGPRPVNFHLQALEQMGAHIEHGEHGYRATAPKGLHGTLITLPYPSVGATENIIFAAVLAEGRTRIENAAIEPEIVDIVKFLQQMGAIIEFGANRTITVDGVKKLHGATYHILPDRLEAASWANVALATNGHIKVEGARQDEMISFLNTVRRIGGDYEVNDTGIHFRRGVGPLHGIELETDTYPGFATDYQQPTIVTLTQAEGLSVVHETVFEDRFGYTEDLRRMGANVGVFDKCLGEIPCRYRNYSMPHSAVIKGMTHLHGTEIEIPDIRAGMAQVIAALVADGESKLTGIHHLERGYGQAFWHKLHAIGADFEVR